MNSFKFYRKTSLTFAPIALAVILAGCAVGPEYKEPTVSMAESYLYVESDESLQTDHWWSQFNDSTMNALVTDVQQQNVPLKMAAQRIKMANSYKSIVESFKVPTINVGAGYYNYQLSKNDSLMGPALSPLGESTSALPPSLSNTTLLDNQHDGGFLGASITWELDILGRIDHQSNAAEIRVEQAGLYADGLTTLITADIVHNYLQYLGAQERIHLAELNIEDQKKSLELIEKVVNNGYGSELDLVQAKASLAAMESIIPQLEIAQQVHKRRIATLLGEPLSKVDIRLASNETLPDMNGVIPVGLPSDLLQRRPDIRIAEREMAAINEEVAASVANRYPKFFLTGAPGVSASSFDDLFSSDSVGWVGSAGVSWNVFDGGRGKAMVELTEARFDAAVLGYEYAVDSAITEVDSMLFAYGRSQENEDRIEQALKASEKAVSKAVSLYNAGLIDHLSVLDAQRQKRVIEDRQVAARLQVAQVTVGVYKSLGGDWKINTEIGD
ncbi:efflux transporter outer membrane subunit [Vibrio sp. VB16]|uniref:efflux transporter outer membrane subunit n=1 Tax=Vibrio sp. VB16 TaxID=2785746 RepID=UPI00189CE74A|nr:efflux transporter outer membrane subunit [Vibrio sp. VB16]UGA56150.1 efflux transporter outer membrane subunit [Vibrio sp. VB16]